MTWTPPVHNHPIYNSSYLHPSWYADSILEMITEHPGLRAEDLDPNAAPLWYQDTFFLTPRHIFLYFFSMFVWLILSRITIMVTPYLLPTVWKNLDPAKAEITEWGDKIVSVTHATLAFLGASYVFYHSFGTGIYQHYSFHPLDSFNSVMEDVVCMTAGYFLYDLISFLINGSRFSIPMMLHHSLSTWSLMHALSYRHYEGVMGVFEFLELSTPFVCMRWILEKNEMKNTKIYVINGIMMMFTFLIRVIFSVGVMYQIIHKWPEFLARVPLSRLWMFVTPVLLCTLNVYWAYIIWKGGLKALRERFSQKKPNPTSTANTSEKTNTLNESKKTK